jgi:hypothetical protein
MELLHLLSPRDDLLTAGMDEQPASDPSALVRIIVVLCMIFAWLVMAARIELRRPLSKKFRLDDWMTLVATVLALAQQVVVMMGLPRKQTAAAAGGMDDAVCSFFLFLYCFGGEGWGGEVRGRGGMLV